MVIEEGGPQVLAAREVGAVSPRFKRTTWKGEVTEEEAGAVEEDVEEVAVENEF